MPKLYDTNLPPHMKRLSKPSAVGAAPSGSAFEVAPIELRFQCTHAVYAHGGDSSFCYVTSAERGEFIAAALDAWKASGGMQAWLDLRLKPNAGTER